MIPEISDAIDTVQNQIGELPSTFSELVTKLSTDRIKEIEATMVSIKSKCISEINEVYRFSEEIQADLNVKIDRITFLEEKVIKKEIENSCGTLEIFAVDF